jgi:hypothetical protein
MPCLVAPAAAHNNDRGMDYSSYSDARGLPCRNDRDCLRRPISPRSWSTVMMVRLLIEGEWHDVLRYFVVAENATDGRAHWCGKTSATGAVARPPCA